MATFSSVNLKVSEEQRAKLRTRTDAQLKTMRMSMSITPEMTEIFGQNAVKMIGPIRTAIAEVLQERKAVPQISYGNVMSAVWTGKADMSYDKKTEEFTFDKGGDQVNTGKGPILAITPVQPEAQYSVHLLSCFLRETASEGIKVVIPDDLVAKYHGVNLAPLYDFASVLEAKRDQMYPTKETLVGLPFQGKLLRLLEAMGPDEQRKLATSVVLQVLKTGRGAKKHEYTVAKPMEPKEKPDYIHQKLIDDKSAYLIWKAPYPIEIVATKVVKKVKEDNPLVTHLDWVTMMTTAMGGSSLKHITAASGLCPGLSDTEAGIIRYVSVAMYFFSQGRSIVVSAPVNHLTLLGSSLRRYNQWRKSEGQQELDIRARVKLYSQSLKPSAKVTLLEVFGEYVEGQAKKNSVLVAWAPQSFTMQSSMTDMTKANRVYYRDLDSFTKRVVFRQVVEPKPDLRYYLDGHPDVLNFWESTEVVQAMGYCEETGYHTVEMSKEIDPAQLFQVAKQAATVRLKEAFRPNSKRSLRVLAVKGDQRLTVRVTDDGTDLFDYESGVIDESQFDAEDDEGGSEDDGHDTEGESSEEEEEKAPSKPLKNHVKKKGKPQPEPDEEGDESSASEAQDEDEELPLKKKRKKAPKPRYEDDGDLEF